MKVLCLHTAGLGDLVAAALREDARATVHYADNSAVLIQTPVPEALPDLPYLKNTFEVLGTVSRAGDLPRAVQTITQRLPGWGLPRRTGPFRLMFSADGTLQPIPAARRSRLEAVLARVTGGTFAPRGGGQEYWTITRRDLPQVLFTRRLPSAKKAPVQRGELAPELAALIVAAAGPARADQVVLDPFAGSGSLIRARMRSPLRRAICSDLLYHDTDRRPSGSWARRAAVRILADDARSLPSVPHDSVDVVLTDPPWGEFADTAADLLPGAIASIARVLKPGGAVAMLSSRRGAEQVRRHWDEHGLRVHGRFEILVNGHPATLLTGALR